MALRIFQFEKNIVLTLFKNSSNKKHGRRCCSKYFVTTPIFYVNAEPHIGHLYTAVIGDAIVRYKKLKNSKLPVKYMVGTDEHGLKIWQTASELKVDVKEYCDKISDRYKQLFNLYSVKGDDFVRTTERRHSETVHKLWNKVASKGLIYKDNYSGWYSVADETFVSEVYLEPELEKNDVRYTTSKKPVQFVSEINYKFKLSKFQQDLLNWLKKGDVVKPIKFHDILYRMIEEGDAVKDISVSRPAERVPWGVEVPGDSSQNIYVWFDALSSYLTTNGYPRSNFKWPPDLQIIGKDILKFHGIYWPAFLMAADLDLPKCIFCHSHWMKDSEKMSKSLGNIVDPFKQEEKYSSDGFRYFLLRAGVPDSDTNFTDDRVTKTLNAELADTLGNLLSRSTGKIVNAKQVFPELGQESHEQFCKNEARNLVNLLIDLPDVVDSHFEEFNFYKGIDAIIATLHQTNKYFDYQKPWEMCKNPDQENHLKYTLHLTLESLRVCGILLQPIIPNVATSLLNKLSIPETQRNLADIRPFSWELENGFKSSTLSKEKIILFRKVKGEETKQKVAI